MVDMNETQEESGPRVTGEHMRDVARLRRSASDRYVAGVAGGLGRHFDVDPTVVRVVLAVLTLFGGAGLLLYVAVWLLVPEDGQGRAPIDLRSDVQRAILIGAAVLAAVIVLGTPFTDGGWGWGFPLPLLVVGLLGLWIYSLVRRDKHQQPPPAPWTQEGTTMSTGYEQTQPVWTPPSAPAYVPPPRPRRTGLVLFWPTLALVAIAEGLLGMWDVDHAVDISAYAALGLAITALMLLVGAFVGRPGGLIALGLAGSVALGVTSVVDAATGGAVSDQDIRANPMLASEVMPDYTFGTGSLTLDLSQVTDIDALDGRDIDINLNAGDVTVILPTGLNAQVDASIRYAGEIDLDDYNRGGFNISVERTLASVPGPGAPTIDLDIESRVGQITVATTNAN